MQVGRYLSQQVVASNMLKSAVFFLIHDQVFRLQYNEWIEITVRAIYSKSDVNRE